MRIIQLIWDVGGRYDKGGGWFSNKCEFGVTSGNRGNQGLGKRNLRKGSLWKRCLRRVSLISGWDLGSRRLGSQAHNHRNFARGETDVDGPEVDTMLK
ncbi:hypothetical protein M5689_020659 [Euphorbia peplus]|nr:hypothetical protein M5689_020659 [Euphorbia peplus]